ncbi:MAG: 3-methyl-2-oxobutanoate hydroxymethyltransferase [Roseiflexaceae bacterium]|nr:3-methyl-2-oxobutanoate hydroxymethyltransferase [Roseiflexus sp.]MDW8213152.1 3-methyl-2-oxobutanoate hydroxymethyltransferase [Roseiflexaceae bacterium]
MRKTITDIQQMKARGEPIAMLTAYDSITAALFDAAGVPILLVGDSLGDNVLGFGSTIPVTLDDMVRHTAAVARGAPSALIVADMPFLTYATVDMAIAAARRLMQEGGAQAVKLEGGQAMTPIVRRLVECGVPVMGHLGYTPQSVHVFGKARVQGRSATAARRMIEDALALEEAGAFALVLELVPAQLAAAITERLRIPTIGIGAGPHCDGQVQVSTDMLGLRDDFKPRHARRFAELAPIIRAAAAAYIAAVSERSFPADEHSSRMDEATLREALEGLA